MLGALPLVHKGRPETGSYYNVEAAREEGDVTTGHEDTSIHVGILMVIGLFIIIGLHLAGFRFVVEAKAGK
jgi:hypothetical protein